ncbi:MAG: M28 family metallopeptidase [Candidatus Eisenbacteria bacterium]|nr:M28 family metallopeptidase [Candidatus Eisenbacteria bacterium]
MRSIPRLLWSLAPASLILALALPPAPPARAAEPAAPARITGFRAAEVEAERAREAAACAVPKADSLRRHLRILTAEPHVAGTPADRATAEYVRDRLAAWGWEAKIEAIPVWLNYPKLSRLELVEPTREPLAVRERGVAWDKDAYDGRAFDAFHGYGAAGDVTAPVVYANYGDVDDLKKLAELGIEVKGRIVLVRYGKIFRGLKVRNAERAGAAGVVIYSDPLDDGYDRADPYPRGQARPEDAIQRGSVQFLSEGPGDPTTPGWASREGGRRLAGAQAAGVPRIPSLPIAYGEAQKILLALEGPVVPAGWQGGLAFTYHVGPGPAKLHLETAQDYAVRPIWDVVATLKGREAPDQWVICGNHRDAWTFGAVDPNSGTIAMLEMARALGELAKTGWRPRRTLMLCSWDGEEYGLLGSTEWAEAHADELGEKAVAYVNVDAAVSGKEFGAGGSHALRDLLAESLGEVADPGLGAPLQKSWSDRLFTAQRADWARRNRERRWRGEPERPFEPDLSPLGSGSDYTAFEDHLGIPSLNLGFDGLHGTYHAIYDDFEFMDRVVDPGYPYHLALTRVWTRVALRLAEAEALPLRFSNTAQFVQDELQAIEERMDDANVGVTDSTRLLRADLRPARAAAAHLREAARAFEQRADAALAGGGSLATINAALMAAERELLGAGLPGRAWFRNELYAPGLNTGYAAVPLPRLGQAVLDRDPVALAAGVAPIAQALERAAAALEQAK